MEYNKTNNILKKLKDFIIKNYQYELAEDNENFWKLRKRLYQDYNYIYINKFDSEEFSDIISTFVLKLQTLKKTEELTEQKDINDFINIIHTYSSPLLIDWEFKVPALYYDLFNDIKKLKKELIS